MEFFPGRMPMMQCGRPGPIAVARSVMSAEGILGTNNSPPLHALEGLDDEIDPFLQG